ncbi:MULTISPECIES: hypothetical protein [Streptomyces]|uniref:hypothetical protein n=1 Tax=Streptomyces TaxID=1883 RepID=UPI000AD88B8F|nr:MULTISPECIES: hypothetical protein [Streptomyces]
MTTRVIVRGITGKRIAAAFCTTTVLVTAAACGDDKGADSAGAKPLAQAEISSAALAPGDVSGYTIRETSVGSGSGGPAWAAKKSCQPIVNVMYPEASAYDKRLASRSIVKTPEGSRKPTVAYRLVLSSVTSEMVAEQSVKDLKKAITACGSGFDTSLSGPAKKIGSVTANESSLGDNGVDFSLEYQMGRKVRYVVTQDGACLTSISAEDEFAHKFVAVPREIVDAQERKLDRSAK